MFADPIKNLKQLGLREDMIVADLGAGTGFYSIAAAKMVPNGKVYAIEVIKDYLITIKNKAKEFHINNLECFWGDIEKLGGTKLKDGIVDAVILSNILSQIEDKSGLVLEVKRILKQNGKVLVVDWSESSALGPKPDKIILKDKVVEIFAKKGLTFNRDIDAGSHHYGIVLTNKKI